MTTYDDDDTDDTSVLRDGETRTIPVFMRDTMDEKGNVVHTSATVLRDSGLRYDPIYNCLVRDAASVEDAEDDQTDGDTFADRQSMLDWQKAELSARWKGGVSTGDLVRIKDQNYVVRGHPSANIFQLQLQDATTLDADGINELKEAAYLDYAYDIEHAYLGDRKPKKTKRTAAKTKKEAEEEPEKDEFELAGPLSDAQTVLSGDARALKDACYEEYRREIENAWRRKE